MLIKSNSNIIIKLIVLIISMHGLAGGGVLPHFRLVVGWEIDAHALARVPMKSALIHVEKGLSQMH